MAALVSPGAARAAVIPSLKDACKDMFLIGTALDFRTANEFNAEELDLIKSQFNLITPENSMKTWPCSPPGKLWNWTQPEALVSFCQENHIKTMGHCLVVSKNWIPKEALIGGCSGIAVSLTGLTLSALK